MGLKYAKPEILFQTTLAKSVLVYAPGYLLFVHFDFGPQAESCKIRMKHPYYITLSLYAVELDVPRARWDTHKLNSIENSIWDQTFPGANNTGIIMYKRHTVRFSQNNHDFKGPHPESENNLEANLKVLSLWEVPHWRISFECFRTVSKWTLVKKRGSSRALSIFPFHNVLLDPWSCGAPSKKWRIISSLWWQYISTVNLVLDEILLE